MRLLTLIPVLLLAGCISTAPNFPDIPLDLQKACPELSEAAPSQQMSKLLDTVVQNYGTYYECRVKVESFIEWHKTQKEIYEKAVK